MGCRPSATGYHGTADKWCMNQQTHSRLLNADNSHDGQSIADCSYSIGSAQIPCITFQLGLVQRLRSGCLPLPFSQAAAGLLQHGHRTPSCGACMQVTFWSPDKAAMSMPLLGTPGLMEPSNLATHLQPIVADFERY